uniref:Reverse transcriptase domain-containing protein n=1 Tax=Cannabis sativa TaxID=3483 RepID=A0A803Q2L3_CANSA
MVMEVHSFKKIWDLVGRDIVEVVLSFLNSGKIFKEINTTTITLIAKTACPKSVVDFRPISCCNVMYKIATKVICNRLRGILPDLIVENQGGFAHGRFIAHNVLVCQDLVRLYGRKNCKPSYMIKIDLRKAYDTIEWDILEEMMRALGFPGKFINLIMECISTPKFSLLLNDAMCGFFNAKRGLRQGVPMSPLLFVLGMEYLFRIFTKVGEWSGFKFYDRCAPLKLNHMCFADDLVTLINFVLLAIHTYWAQIYVLPKKLLIDNEATCRSFLWKGTQEGAGPGLVAWDYVCGLRSARGLGFRNIHQWNIATLGRYVWDIASKKDCLFVKWIHMVYLKDQDWWSYVVPLDCSWAWKKIVAVENKFQQKGDMKSFVMQRYKVKQGYQVLFSEYAKLPWCNLVWDRFIIPKHRFILWLVF